MVDMLPVSKQSTVIGTPLLGVSDLKQKSSDASVVEDSLCNKKNALLMLGICSGNSMKAVNQKLLWMVMMGMLVPRSVRVVTCLLVTG